MNVIRGTRLRAARVLGRHTEQEWEALVVFCESKCVMCGAGGKLLHKDHILPLCAGGSDGIENLQPLCGKCNCAKSGYDDTDFRPKNWRDALVGVTPYRPRQSWVNETQPVKKKRKDYGPGMTLDELLRNS